MRISMLEFCLPIFLVGIVVVSFRPVSQWLSVFIGERYLLLVASLLLLLFFGSMLLSLLLVMAQCSFALDIVE